MSGLCVTSVMLPRWGLDETFDHLASCGFAGIELRVRANPDNPAEEPSFWGRHVADVSPVNVMANAPRILAAARRTGVAVVALSPRVAPTDGPGLEALCRAAVAMAPGAPPMIRVDPARYDRDRPYRPQFDAIRSAFAAATAVAKPFGIKILYEIHTGTVAMSATRAATLLDGLDPSRIGAIYDIPNMARVGLEDPRQGMEALGPYLAHCHIGGSRPVLAAGEPARWSWEFCSLMEGIADIPAILADLRHVGYAGWLSLEDFAPGDDLEKVRVQGAWLRSLGAGG